MNRGWLVILAGCLILGFQNCSQANLSQGDFPSTNAQIISPSVGSGSEADEISAASSLEIPVSDGLLSVDAASGRISLVARNGQILEESCLQKAEIAELQSYLKMSNVCSPETQIDASAQCGQVYTPGYATVVFGEQRLNLGESYDSCGRGYKDICGDQAQSFRGLVAYIQKNFHSLLCE
ncbi:hypothetical protein [Bdellovibrio sp. HCB209]|uniref:hypothetical protein n=1 Tax=Bdellovibrio sp. HCB209 TaxID=3394354 RepID=UPI0039B41AB6